MSPRDLSLSTLQQRLPHLQQLLDALTEIGPVTTERLADDIVTRLAVERILTQLVALAAEINQHVASSLGDATTTEYRASFDMAARHGLISPELSAQLKPSVGLRNILVHEYVNIDLGQVALAAEQARIQYAEYLRSVSNWIANRTG